MLNIGLGRGTRPALSLFGALVLLALIGVILVAVVRSTRERPVVVRTSGGAAAPSPKRGRPPAIAAKAVPVSPGFRGCPPEGDGGDRELNRLKNRVDSADWIATPFDTVLGLSWPRRITNRSRAGWNRSDAAAISSHEGLPIAVVGYFAGAKQEGPEATNCHGADATFRDWHLWLAGQPGRNRRQSIVVEVTPAVRASHPEWSLSAIHKLVRDSTPVRVSGWLMLDPEHPDQLGKTRGTLWEIHPVMQIEVERSGRWQKLDASFVKTRSP